MKPRSKRRPDAIPLGTGCAAADRGTVVATVSVAGIAQVAVGVLGGRPWLPYPQSRCSHLLMLTRGAIPEQQLNVDNRCRLKDW